MSSNGFGTHVKCILSPQKHTSELKYLMYSAFLGLNVVKFVTGVMEKLLCVLLLASTSRTAIPHSTAAANSSRMCLHASGLPHAMCGIGTNALVLRLHTPASVRQEREGHRFDIDARTFDARKKVTSQHLA
jgi:hypothetical protein